MSLCKSCDAEIAWIATGSGKHHPVNAKAEKRWVADNARGWQLVDTYLSHFATCPNADQHRKKKGTDV